MHTYKKNKHLQSVHVCMPCSYILGLQMLKLRVDIKPVTSLQHTQEK